MSKKTPDSRPGCPDHTQGNTQSSTRGGARRGAGRPRRWGAPSAVMRVPAALREDITTFIETRAQLGEDGKAQSARSMLRAHAARSLPLYASKVSAGFPSPADDLLVGGLDLNDHVVTNPAATFYVRASGPSMIGAGIHDDDLLVVDRSLTPRDGSIVIAALDGELTVKRYRRHGARVTLAAENDDYEPIELSGDMRLDIWGVVTAVIHKV
ncbi:MAG: translesion error-prone DNA polymerase V autoproteolytic subunit [Pseudomonadota bacterium]